VVSLGSCYLPAQSREPLDAAAHGQTLRNATALVQNASYLTRPHWLALPQSLQDCALNKSRSQMDEDIVLLPYLMALKNYYGQAAYVEIGALDGLKYSNTMMLEQCAGFSGLLIEGNPDNCKSLERNLAQRPASHAACSAVCDQEAGTVNFTIGGGAVAGMPETMDPAFKNQWHSSQGESIVAVPCTRMHNLMVRVGGMASATFLSLDVEGGEQVVLKGTAIRDFALIMVETGGVLQHAGRSTSGRNATIQLIMDAGFVRPPFDTFPPDAWDEVFVRNDTLAAFAALAEA